MAHKGRKQADELLAIAIATGKTCDEASKAAGLSLRTVSRRMADRDFQRRVAEIQTELLNAACGKLADSLGESADVLRTLLRSAREDIRLKASAKIIESMLKVHDLSKLRKRVARLVTRLNEVLSSEAGVPGGDREVVNFDQLRRVASEAAMQAMRDNEMPEPREMPHPPEAAPDASVSNRSSQ
jgi:ribosomal protein L29